MWKDIKNKYVVERNKRRRRNQKTKNSFYFIFMLRHCEKKMTSRKLGNIFGGEQKIVDAKIQISFEPPKNYSKNDTPVIMIIVI
jgi:hypothetical protein